MSIDEAIRKAFELGSSNIIKESGNRLLYVIHQCFKEADELRWPQSVPELEHKSKIPIELETFLSHVITKLSVPKTPKVQRLNLSIAQDVCRAAAGGEWKLSKPLLLSMTLRHLCRSEQLVTLSKRMGHCENYFYTLELETGLARGIEETRMLLSTRIIRAPESRSVFHSESHNGHRVEMPSVEMRKQRSLSMETSQLLECHITARRSPKLTITHMTYPVGEDAFHEASQNLMLWNLCQDGRPG